MVVVYMWVMSEIYIDQVEQPTHLIQPHTSSDCAIFYHEATEDDYHGIYSDPQIILIIYG